MEEDESYEIMPYKEVVALKKEIEALKKKTGDTSSKDLINSVAKLTKNMDSMLQLFRTAAESMKAEESTEEKFANKIEPLIDKLDEIIDQNKVIAEGMVAIADIVKGKYRPTKPIPKPIVKPAAPPEEEFPPLGPELPPAPRPPVGVPPGPAPRPHNLPPLEPMPPGGLPPLGPGAPPMPSGGLPPLEEKPRKKGLFGSRKK